MPACLPLAVGALFVLAACTSGTGAGGAQGASVTPAPGGTVELVGKINNTFDITHVAATAGQLTIDFSVPGGTPHNFQVEGIVGTKIGLLSGGEKKAVTFAVTPGTYTYVCTIHTGMEGTLTVSPASP